ncbi:Glycoside hydrolase, family 28 [Heracleum sosnowskyi]|uniref:Glycoside hydrolase, family 28 n=1 Tax=Heracleum sosnowskyi TaxID=360622 RepID=A0AAD8HBD8_9APIA|nr:Glycoside hydrolase, family 28 [Heracleum sosnowskyi]
MAVLGFLKYVTLFSLLANCVLSLSVVNVRDHGVVGDGIADDTQGLLRAWEATCKSSSSSATMHFPANLTFLTHPLFFNGPCKPRTITVEIHGTITAPSEPKQWRCGSNDCDSWIRFSHVDGLFISGSSTGTISGRGEKWWNVKGRHKPAALRIINSKNLGLSGLRFKDNPRMHIVLDGVQGAHLTDLKIEAPSHSPNTDGIHIGKSTNVSIDHCTIGTGDDCISIGGGSKNLRINNIRCGPGHGVSIGSLGKHGASDEVEDIQIRDVVFTNTTNGARIKTWQGGKGYARNIAFERILCQNSDNPIIIDQFYCDHETCADHNSAVKVSGVTFRDVMGTSKRETAVKIDCSKTVPCEGITMENVYLKSNRQGKKASAYCSNVRGRLSGRIVPKVSLN